MPEPTVDFVVKGTGSVGVGGQFGKAVDKLRPPADLGFASDSELCVAVLGCVRSWACDWDCCKGVDTLRAVSLNVLILDRTGVTGVLATDTGIAS